FAGIDDIDAFAVGAAGDDLGVVGIADENNVVALGGELFDFAVHPLEKHRTGGVMDDDALAFECFLDWLGVAVGGDDDLVVVFDLLDGGITVENLNALRRQIADDFGIVYDRPQDGLTHPFRYFNGAFDAEAGAGAVGDVDLERGF